MSILGSYPCELNWQSALLSVACIEIGFFIYVRRYLLPFAQTHTPPGPVPYRDYPCPAQDRVQLLRRICRRLERQAVQEPRHDIRKRLTGFLLAWFRPVMSANDDQQMPPPGLLATSFLSPSSSSGEISSDEETNDDDDDLGTKNGWSIAGLKKAEVDDFFAWAFFGKETNDLLLSEQVGMQKMYDELAKNYGLTFEQGKGGLFEGRRLTLDPIQSIHRPLLVYAILHGLERIGNLILILCGFQRHIAKSGLVYWHRAGREFEKRLPLLFFHGISPAGKTFYLPLCLLGLGDRQRSMYFFENRSITGSYLTFDVRSEDETVSGVTQALHRHGDNQRPISICGHSFGSCPMTWLLHSSLRDNIEQFVLIDPVTILLSEPDVMYNFLYARLEDRTKAVNRHLAGIRFVGSELFTEHYLRRSFVWYNSELWLEDIPASVKVLICLSEKDQILSAPNVKQEVDALMATETTSRETRVSRKDNVTLIYWQGVDHADCITNPRTWPQLRYSLLNQEQCILKKES